MKTEERKGGRQNGGRKGSGRRDQEQAEGEPKANPAETHMDFLA
jgi:hypothetical protein